MPLRPLPLPSALTRLPRLLALALPAACALLAACAAAPEPRLEAPAVEARVAYRSGDPIGGALDPAAAEGLELRAEDALSLSGRLYLLAGPPGRRCAPISEQLRLIVAEEGSQPLAPASQLVSGMRIALGPEAAALGAQAAARPPAEGVLSASFEGLSLPGVTTSMVATQVQPLQLAGYRPAQRSVGVELWREQPSDEGVSVALVVSDVVERIEGLADERPVVTLRPYRETLVLDVRLAGPDRTLALLAPAAFDPSGRLSYLLVLEVGPRPADEAALGQRLELVRAELGDAAAAALARERAPDLAASSRLRAIEALGTAAYRRAALVEVAGSSGAPLAAELALMADDEVVAQLAERLAGETELLRELAADGDVLAWRLEREALLMFAQILSERDLSPEYEALLLQHTGEAGRFPGALEDAVAASSSGLGFYARMLEQNRIALEDSSPSARVRAFDWLASKGVEVPGYDPLADRTARRSALRAWAEAEAAAAAAASEPEGAGQP